MAKKNIKCDTLENWAKATFIPKEDEIIVYSDVGKIKRGDGITPIGDLPYEYTKDETYNGDFFIK